MKASQPTMASEDTGAQISGGAAGGTPLAQAAFKPLPIPGHTPQVSVRQHGAPTNKFQAVQALPHVIHPNSGVGTPMKGAQMMKPTGKLV